MFGEQSTTGGAPPRERQKLETWQWQDLRQRILTSCTEDEPGVVDWDQLPKTIHLGDGNKGLIHKALRCRELTDNDPENRERGVDIAYVPWKDAIATTRDDKIKVGTERDVLIPFKAPTPSLIDQLDMSAREIQRLEASIRNGGSPEAKAAIDSLDVGALRKVMDTERFKQGRRGKSRTIGNIHSHPSRNPFSTRDVINVLADPDRKISMVATLDGIRAIITTTETEWVKCVTVEDYKKLLAAKETEWNQTCERSLQAKLNANSDLREQYESSEISRTAFRVAQRDAFYAQLSVDEGFGYYKGDLSGVVRRLIPKYKK